MGTQHVQINEAAEMLGVTVNTLLLAAFEGSVKPWALVNATGYAEDGYYDEPDSIALPNWTPTSDEKEIRFLAFAPLSPFEAGVLLRREPPLKLKDLDIPLEPSLFEGELTHWSFLSSIEVSVEHVYLRRADLTQLRERFAGVVANDPPQLPATHVDPSLAGSQPSGPTMARLLGAVAEFPRRYRDYRTRPPKLDADVKPWLSAAGLAKNEAEVRVFGAILREHFQLSPDTRKT